MSLTRHHVKVLVVRWLAVLCVAQAGAGSQVLADPLTWIDPLGGLASDAANWSPAQVPAAADDLSFDLPSNFSVTFNAATAASRTHTYQTGVVTLTVSSPHTVSTGITIGDEAGDAALMRLTTGTLTVNAPCVVGNAGGSTGTLDVNDDDADFIIGNGADLTVGSNGAGTMSITGTGHVQVADQFIAGNNATSTSNINVSGFSVAPVGISLLEVLGAGQSRIGQGGDATMTIQNGASARFAGDLVIANGSASTSSITVQNPGLLDASLNVTGDLLIGRNTGTSAAGLGTLILNTDGAATIGGDTLLGDPDGGTGTLHMDGGTFTGTGGIEVLDGSLIDGTGTINADIQNSGDIEPTGAAGLTLNGILTNDTSNQIVGTKLQFGPSGGYRGSGTCTADITGDVASTITATGALRIGRNSTSGYFYLGSLDVGGNGVTLLDSNGAVLGGLTTIDGGQLICPAGIGVQNGGTIRGNGELIGTLTAAGAIDPEDPGTSGGLITVQGNLIVNPSGKFDIALGGSPPSNDYDKMVVSGTATFGGTMRVSLKNGFIPRVGQQFIAINATGGRTGEFAAIEPPTGPNAPCNNVTFVLVYSSTAAIVLIRPPLGCTALGDLNSDGGCDGKDIQLFVNALLSPAYESCADMNGNCQNDVGDIPIMLNCLL